MSTAEAIAPRAKETADRRSWVARHKFLTAFIVLFMAALVGGYIWGWPLMKWRFDRLFIDSLGEIQKSPQAVEKLGDSISTPYIPAPSGMVDINEDGKRGNAQFFFTVAGSKSTADAVSIMRLIDGKWGYTQLKLTFPDKTSLDLTQGIQQGGDDVPKFDPNAKQSIDVQPPKLNVDISLPDLPAEPKR